MPRIALGGFLHETNTFSPIPTTFESFASRSALLCGIYQGKELEKVFRGKIFNNSICGFYAEADKHGFDIVPIAKIGEAEPSGTIPRDLFYQLLGLITQGLQDQGPFDGVYLDLHGAMVYAPNEEGEIEILRKVRDVVGDIPVVASLDLHGNISQKFFDNASALVGYRTYPHVDIYDTGVRCARVMDHLLRGKPLYKAFHQVPFLMPGSTLSTNRDPSKTLYATIDKVERDPDIISASIMQGFVESDIEHMGPTVFAYATSQRKADDAALKLLQKALDLEPQFRADLPDACEGVRQAVALAKNAQKPVILADGQDNPGGGASSDTVWILEEMVRQKAPESAVALMYDPEAASIAHAAGESAKIEIDLGGKLTPGHNPFHGKFRVEKLFAGEFTCTGPMAGGMTTNLGKMAQLRIANIRIVVASHRTQILDQSYMRVVGVEPAKMKILVLKSTNHYRADFEPISSTIIDVAAPSALVNNPETYEYQNLRDGVRLQGMGRVYHKKK
jgi:microcystin degradation protein MlrC